MLNVTVSAVERATAVNVYQSAMAVLVISLMVQEHRILDPYYPTVQRKEPTWQVHMFRYACALHTHVPVHACQYLRLAPRRPPQTQCFQKNRGGHQK